MQYLRAIAEKFAASGWPLIEVPAKKWLDGQLPLKKLMEAVQQAQAECGTCGCEYDALYDEFLHLAQAKAGAAN